MISSHTAPGTKIVCIDDSHYHDGFVHAAGLGGLKKDAIYTVLRMQMALDRDVLVILAEIDRTIKYWFLESGFARRRFRYLELPSVLTGILTSNPADLEVV